MEQNRITLDAHTLVWTVDSALNYRLSEKAKQAITQAERNGIIYIPIIALLEVFRLIEKGKCSLSFEDLLKGLEQSENHQIIPFDTELLKVTMTMPKLELHDRLIVATAIMTDSILVSKDREIERSGIKILWSQRIETS
jgi:PIN domain nuclease of toxin-antitoxin system